tara:strand:+ start:893 stop:1978 length:1086 start_codon:yes stop_codon:yes gene_type:complete
MRDTFFKLSFILFLIPSLVLSQPQTELLKDTQRIEIKPFYSKAKFDSKTGNLLLSKINKLLNKQGLSSYGSRFVIWPRVDLLSQESTSSTSKMYVTELDVTFYIGDNQEQTIFAQNNYTVKGVGSNKDKSYYNALKKIKSTNDESLYFITEAKSRIIDLFNSNCKIIISESIQLSERNEFDKALSNLMSIPSVCYECYNNAQEVAVEIFSSKQESECGQNITKASAAILKDDFDLAIDIISKIYPDVSCYSEAQEILSKIDDEMCSDYLGKAKAAWSNADANNASRWLSEISSSSSCATDAADLGERIKKEIVDFEWELTSKAQNDMVKLEQQRIDAIKEIGVAYGNNQQQSYSTTWISRY